MIVFIGTRAEMEDFCRTRLSCSALRAEVDRRVVWVGNVPYQDQRLWGLQGPVTVVTTGSVRASADVQAQLRILGECDHLDRCCPEHGTHAVAPGPHKGCVLR